MMRGYKLYSSDVSGWTVMLIGKKHFGQNGFFSMNAAMVVGQSAKVSIIEIRLSVM